MGKPYVLTPDHFMAFGSIIQNFARHEYLMQTLMSAIIEAPVTPISMLTVELSYRARREALLSLMKAKPLPKKQIERIETFLSSLHKRNALRNAIAHNVWKEGKRSGTVRPLGLSVRGGAVAFKGMADDEEEYTVDKLIKIANELGRLHDKFSAYLEKEGLLVFISEKIDTKSDDTSSSPGKPSAK
jgi:hypothetical protein